MNTELLIEILEQSVNRNGEITLTNKHLLNIIKMHDRVQARQEFDSDMMGCMVDAGI